MGDIQPHQSSGLQIIVEQISAERSAQAGYWMIRWLVANAAAQPLRISGIRMPHGQFKAEPLLLEPAIGLQPGGEDEFHMLVRCDEPPGLVTENAFLIFDVVWNARRWRVFVRLRVTVTADGIPETAAESITTQEVGFSQRKS